MNGQKQQVRVLQGGLDVVTPAMMVKPGFAIAAQNYESEVRGYRRVLGYERFDGRPKPSKPDYITFNFATGSTQILEGDVITGATSGATATALFDIEATDGSFGIGNAIGVVVAYLATGTFTVGENIQVSAATVASVATEPLLNSATTDEENETYRSLIAALHRAAIQKPVGSGPIRGVVTYRGDKYCWRDNVGGTAGQMFKATTAGWVLQTFGHFIRFNAATAQFFEGETVTGGTSGATATVERVVLSVGSWTGGSGYLVLSGLSGAFTTGETLTTALGSATAQAAQAAISLQPGGRYRSETSNFYATESFERLYFVNGVDRAHEWDGSVLAPIRTGLSAALDKPTHIGIQKFHLFLAYAGGSLIHSGIGEPLSTNVLQGAGEIGFGQTITGIKSEYRDSMIITGRNKVGYLVGTSAEDFDLKTVTQDSGAVEDTLMVVGKPIFLDDQGLRDMEAAQQYGDWRMGTVSQLVEPLFTAKRDTGLTPVACIRVRKRDLYRIVYSDGTGFVVYFGRKDPEIMPMSLGFIPSDMQSGEDANGVEELFAGGEDGFVYELDSGNSFDGEVIEAYLRLAFDNQGMPNMQKRYHRSRLEGKAGGTRAGITISADYTYGDPDQPPSAEDSFVFNGQGGFYDEMVWNEFQWSSSIEGQAFADLESIGENVSITFISDSATEDPHTLSTLTIFYTPRRAMR